MESSVPQKVRVLIIGQTPPPYGGQALSIQRLVTANFDDIEIHHVRMHYSRTFTEVGRFKIRKVFHLFRILLESVYKAVRYKIDVIHYPPGAERIPLIRDIFTLLILRLLSKRIVLIFHASGLSEEVSKWRGLLLWLFKKAFYYVDAGVQTSALNPPDAAFVHAKKTYVVANGIPDEFPRWQNAPKLNTVPIVLYVGVVRRDKGINVLLESASILKARGLMFSVKIVGEFVSAGYRNELEREIANRLLGDVIQFTGPRVGDEKWILYRQADVFCYPTFAPFESFGNVLLEAMMFELPVVSTRWRGIPSIVEEGVTGFLVAIQSPEELAERLEILLRDADLRATMGQKGRERYLHYFTKERYLQGLRRVFIEVANSNETAQFTRRTEKHPSLVQ
ncbi:MAG TPA: glycosyltransferase family 4 protein [Nitrososphaera sp.]|nr:glycosyltransferase family 4 protein [Nitrososphaera sp.]